MADKKCGKCGRKIPVNNLFCPYCGSKQNSVRICVKCKKQIKGEAQYCPFCGSKQEEIITCGKCGALMKKDDRYCFNCGSDERPELKRPTDIVYKENRLLKYNANNDTSKVGLGYFYDIEEYYYSGVTEEIGKNFKVAFENYKKAYEMHGYTGGMKYAKFLWNGIGCKPDRKLAIKVFTDLAEKKNVKAMVWLGIIYMNGMNIAQDKETAMKWFDAAVKIDQSELFVYPYLKWNMDPAILYGMGLFNSGKKSAAENIIKARIGSVYMTDIYLTNLGGLVRELLDGTQTFFDSDHDFAKFLEKEIVRKKTSLTDNGVPRENSVVDGGKCYREGSKYLNGEGVIQNPLKAIKWFIRGGQAGHAECQYYAGYVYACGLLGEPDYEKCKYWYLKAAGNGIKEAAKYLNDYKDFFQNVDSSNVQEPPVTEAEIMRIDRFRDRILNVAKEYGDVISKDHKEYYFAPKIPLKSLNNAVASYAHGISPGNILFLYDATFDNDGKKGFVFTDKMVISSSGARIDYNEISALGGKMDGGYFNIIALPSKQIIYQAYDRSMMEAFIEVMNKDVFRD